MKWKTLQKVKLLFYKAKIKGQFDKLLHKMGLETGGEESADHGDRLDK